MPLYVFLFVAGLVLIILGGGWFVDAASWLAKVTGVSQVLIGATIVSLGTTMPELMVSTSSVVQGYSDLAFGNAIGSVIFNTGLILGVCNLISPSKIRSRGYVIKCIMLVCILIHVILASLDGELGAFDCFCLMCYLAVYITENYLEMKLKSPTESRAEREHVSGGEIAKHITLFFVGIVCIFIGAQLLIDNGIAIARILGVSELIIGLTAVAIGTSLPELVTSVSAVIKGQRNIAVGNIIGANILNLTMVLGVSSMLGTIEIPRSSLLLDFPAALIIILALVVPSIAKHRISRVNAAVMLALYALYIFLVANTHFT